MIEEDDSLFILYFIVAFMNSKYTKIKEMDISQIPLTLTKLGLESISEVKILTKNAKIMQQQTPFSFQMMCDKLAIFNNNSNNYCREMNKVYNPSSFLAMPIMFNELLYISYKNLFSCHDIKCINFYKQLEIDKMYHDYCKRCEEKNKLNNNSGIYNINNDYLNSITSIPISSNSNKSDKDIKICKEICKNNKAGKVDSVIDIEKKPQQAYNKSDNNINIMNKVSLFNIIEN